MENPKMKRYLLILCLAGFGVPVGCQGLSRTDRPLPVGQGPLAADPPLPEPEPFVRVISGREIHDPSELPAAAPPAPAAKTLDATRLDTVQFSDVPLSQVTLMLTRQTGQNVVVSAAARDKKVTVYLKNVSARAAIEGICRLNNLWYREDPEMIRLLTAEEYGRELVVRRDEQTRLYYLKNASAPAVADMIATLMPGDVEYLRPSEEASFGHVGTDGDDPLANHSSTTGTTRNQATGTADETGAVGGRATSYSSGGRVTRSSYNMSLSDVLSGLQTGVTAGKIEQLTQNAAGRQKAEVSGQTLAEKTDTRPPVVLSVFLRNNCIGVRTEQESLHREIGKMVEALDTPTREVLLEVKVFRVALENDFESFFSLAYSNAGSSSALSSSVLGGAALSSGNASFSFTYMNEHISAAMKLLQTDKRLHTVATPMLLCANNAPAEFFSGVSRMITTNYDYETRYGENNRAVDIARPVVAQRDVGTDVRIKPSINADGTVTLRFHLEIGSVNPGGASIAQINNAGEVVALPVDTIDNERVQSIVVAKHGQAVVMGGLITESVDKSKDRVPVLGDVPVAGFFFSHPKNSIRRTETVIVIIPHIIGTAADGGAASESVLKNNSTHPSTPRGEKPLTNWDARHEKLNEAKP
jgi:type II secretory pathway component GspD/PulD (secretin)